MNAALFMARAGGKWLAITLAALLLAGCVTQQIDWAARVGNYTYDQAVLELGPPDKSAKLTDGTVVADWLTHHAQTVVVPEPYFAPPGCYFGPLTPMRTETYLPAQYLRLTFGPDGKLKRWREVAG
jgi:hypothetical protein